MAKKRKKSKKSLFLAGLAGAFAEITIILCGIILATRYVQIKYISDLALFIAIFMAVILRFISEAYRTGKDI